MTLGIPRALLYFAYAPLWDAFFSELRVATLLSPPTCAAIVERGLRTCVNEACLPLKIFFGHVDWLRSRTDAVFVPRFISVHRGEYICPKFGGLPDMVRWGFDPPPVLLSPRIDLHHDKNSLQQAAIELGRELGYDSRRSLGALSAALESHRLWRKNAHVLFPDPAQPRILNKTKPLILLLGHAYNVYDPFVNRNVVQKLVSRGASILTADSMDERVLRAQAASLERAMFYTFGAQLLGASLAAIHGEEIDGIVFVTSFGCGPDAFIEDMAARRAHAANLPFLTLTIDEHTGEAGLDTRLEAFMDTLSLRAAKFGRTAEKSSC